MNIEINLWRDLMYLIGLSIIPISIVYFYKLIFVPSLKKVSKPVVLLFLISVNMIAFILIFTGGAGVISAIYIVLNSINTIPLTILIINIYIFITGIIISYLLLSSYKNISKK